MSNISAWQQQGSLYLVDNTAGGVVVTTGGSALGAVNYRIVNKAASEQYFAWAGQGQAAPVAPTAPTVGSPKANTIGMLASSVESFSLPPNCQFIAGTSTGFEISAGEGL